MIHDVLLSCKKLYSDRLPIEDLLVTDAVSTFIHPGEKKILEDIINIINLLRDVAKFSKIYGSLHHFTVSKAIVDSDEPLPNGLYLKAFANGIDTVLDQYLDEITDLERRYLPNPSKTLLFIYQRLQVYKPLAEFLRRLIRGIRMHRLHGCAIIQYVHQNSHHGDARIHAAVMIIQEALNVVFLQQLTHWVLYAKLLDAHGEFFIQCVDASNSSTQESDRGTVTSGGKATATNFSDAISTYGDIWRYEICYDFLPNYLSSSWAEKVLFIGQTVLICRVDVNKFQKNSQIWYKAETIRERGVESLWNEKEHYFFAQIQALHSDKELQISEYERVIDEIKGHATRRLSEIAINEADLKKTLDLIKEFYLLGRGELFLEFIRQTYTISREMDHDKKLREYVKAFECAAVSVGATESAENFTLTMPKLVENVDDTIDFVYLQNLLLNYKINWPLHLLFSPKVIERYNLIFRFLLKLKKMQYELHMLWFKHTREFKLDKLETNTQALHLRNHLMFFIDNLQYYIQVDVLESQFSILKAVLESDVDFEQIQRSHSLFQANVLSLCFLLAEENPSKTSLLHSTISIQINNPVHYALEDSFQLCEEFCSLLERNNAAEMNAKIEQLDERFNEFMKKLINLLIGLKTTPCTAPLAQLLLRLDFNRWFSMNKNDDIM